MHVVTFMQILSGLHNNFASRYQAGLILSVILLTRITYCSNKNGNH